MSRRVDISLVAAAAVSLALFAGVALANHKSGPSTKAELEKIASTAIADFEFCVQNVTGFNKLKEAFVARLLERGAKIGGQGARGGLRTNRRVLADGRNTGHSFQIASKNFGPSGGYYQCGIIIENIDRESFYDSLRAEIEPYFQGKYQLVDAKHRIGRNVASFEIAGSQLKEFRIEISEFENHYGDATSVFLLWK